MATRPLLVLTSHAHAPPLRPAPDLKFDLRQVDNPPKALRASHTGTSKRLRDHMLGQDDFAELLAEAERQIREAMAATVKEFSAAPEAAAKTATAAGSKQAEDEASVSMDEGDSDLEDPSRPTLRVGMFCAKGKHRSVAFVEELAARRWPAQWDIKVTHRDLNKPKNVGTRQRKDRRISKFTSGLGDSESD